LEEKAMTQKFVRAQALNLRAAPAKGNNILASLDLNTPVTTTGAVDARGWVPVQTPAGNGFVVAEFLREPLGPGVEALLAAARTEWHRFDRGEGMEDDAPFFRHIGEMWAAIGIDLDGRDTDQPWSSAFISFVVRKAISAAPRYASFRFAAAHSRYVFDAIRRREAADTSAPFWGFAISERKPAVGDIVVKPRAGSGMTFARARTTDSYKSHGDIVIGIDSANFRLITIGGNVGNSCDITIYPLGAGDRLTAASGIFAILANRADAA
jgi:hypothetical protein